MRIVDVEPIPCDFGWRTISFLKVTTDDGIAGWSEFSESFGNAGLGAVIEGLKPYVVGADPMAIEGLTWDLAARLLPARGGVNRQAIAAIENALLDIKGKALGVPVAALLGGVVRERIPVYWSHCGTYRARDPEVMGVEPVETYADVVALGRHVKERGFGALKTNILGLEDPDVRKRMVSHARTTTTAGRHFDNRMIAEAEKTLAAFREGAGPDLDIHLDVNFLFELEGYRRVERAVRPYDLAWLEFDMHDPHGVAALRASATTPIASGEAIYERVGYRPFLEAGSWDVAIIDVLWNGYLESLKIAAMAGAYSVPVAPHNFYGHLATLISAHFAAGVPHLHVMEVDVDSVAWRDDLVDVPPVIENGDLVLPDRPGLGIEVNEEAVRAHPPQR